MQPKRKTENLLESSAYSLKGNRPQNLAEEFWDNQEGKVKLEELIDAYNALSQSQNAMPSANRMVPQNYMQYHIKSPSPVLEVDEDLLKRFYEKGFSNDQAQFVYDLAGERVLPVLDEMAVNFEAERQLEKLAQHFGGRDKFNEVSRSLSNWAKQNVNQEIFNALGTTAEGVIALYNMMSSSEPLLCKNDPEFENLNEANLRKMMEDPRYWRDKDSAYIAKITRGFEKLYPEK